jgi:hypothetical protein
MKIQARLNSHLAAIIKYIQPSQVVILGRKMANSTMGTKFDFFGSLGETDDLISTIEN